MTARPIRTELSRLQHVLVTAVAVLRAGVVCRHAH
jgi:hypothetical protein